MPKQTTKKFTTAPNNALWSARQQSGLELKQVAFLLGHKSTDQISLYERGLQTPRLPNALKLTIIYGASLAQLFPEHYEKYRTELAAKLEKVSRLQFSQKAYEPLADKFHVCSYADLLEKKIAPSSQERETVRDHVTKLARRLANL